MRQDTYEISLKHKFHLVQLKHSRMWTFRSVNVEQDENYAFKLVWVVHYFILLLMYMEFDDSQGPTLTQ